jgi:hypothetical protein
MRRLAALNVQIAEDADRLLARLRLSNAEHERLAAMGTEWWRVSPAMGDVAARALIYRVGPDVFVERALLAFARAGADPTDAAWRDLAALPQRWTAPVFPLRAADLIARGVEKGPALGKALDAAEEAWIVADFPMDAGTTRWQATLRPSGARFSAGVSTLQRSNANGQRVWNVHPGGGLIGDGTSPCSTMRSRFARGSAIGAADINACE